jgi:hypothetical protein
MPARSFSSFGCLAVGVLKAGVLASVRTPVVVSGQPAGSQVSKREIGGVWVHEDVRGSEPSEPYLFGGFEQRMLHLAHESDAIVEFSLDVDRWGDGTWTRLRTVRVPAYGYVPVPYGPQDRGVWIRVTAGRDCRHATAFFEYATATAWPTANGVIFDGLPSQGESSAGSGLLSARGENRRTLLYSSATGLYELDANLAMRSVEDAQLRDWMAANFMPPSRALGADAASII